ncbi:hypothetical protein B0H14DRAFT_2936396 [Mycena olivaceomarginata]|nr:hypothetical protein B0H14DRAFT_2936396 [Mycena olivaceomarginata]
MHPLHDTYLIAYLILFLFLLWARLLLVLSCMSLIITQRTIHTYIHSCTYIHTTRIHTTHVNNIQPTGNTDRGFF